MKKHFLLLLMISLLSCAKAQDINELTPQQFESITINNRPLKSIWGTNGDELAVQNLLGIAEEIILVDDSPLMRNVLFKYHGFELSFAQTGKSTSELSSFKIQTSAPTLRVKGVTIKIGDNISKLGSVQINNMTTGGKSILYSPGNDETVYLSIRFDPKTNLITEIVYYVLT